jgi:hypothetical protein
MMIGQCGCYRFYIYFSQYGVRLPMPMCLRQKNARLASSCFFDGKTFAGWNDPTTKQPAGDSWSIRDGALVARKDPRILEDLTTVESFGNFEFMFEWRLEPSGNSGVKYRAWDSAFLIHDKPGWENGKLGEHGSLREDQRGQTYIVAFEFQLLDDERHPDAKNGPDRRTGALYAVRAPVGTANANPGQWHTGLLKVDGSHIEHRINGRKQLSADLQAADVIENVKERWSRIDSVWRHFLERAGKASPIALQNHGDSVAEFRNLKIRTH